MKKIYPLRAYQGTKELLESETTIREVRKNKV